jgi:hypothetical protein
MTIFLRQREVLERITIPESEGELCTYCGKPIVEGLFHWLGEDGQPVRQHQSYGGAVESFPSWRHADGSEGHGYDHCLLLAKERCPSCKAHGTLTRRGTGYGDDITCTACRWNKYFDRGD